MQCREFVVFDEGTGGHHVPYVAQTLRGLLNSGASVTASLNEGAVAAVEREVRVSPGWSSQIASKLVIAGHPSATGRLSHMSSGEIKHLQALVPSAPVIDLAGDVTVWSRSWLGTGRPTIHVFHQWHALSHATRSWRGWATAPLYLASLASMRSGSERIVVHRRSAVEHFARVVGARRVEFLPMPSTAPPEQVDPSAVEEGSLLFVGSSRADKGLDVLLGALRVSTVWKSAEIWGPQPTWVETAIRSFGGRIRARYVEDEHYDGMMARKQLLVLPYRRLFELKRQASLVLVDGLRNGVPMVVSDALAELLPAGFEGAVVVEADNVASLKDGIGQAFAKIGDLSIAAREQGPAAVRAWSYDNYAAHLAAML